MDRPLRLIAPNPVDELARTIEALLVVASQPLSERRARRRPPTTTPSGSRRRWRCSASATARVAAASCSSTSPAAGRSAPRARRPRRARRLFERPGRARALAGGARDARDRRLPRPVLAPRDRPDPRRRTPTASSPGSSSAACSPRPAARASFGARPLPDDPALRARLRARVARRAAAPRRPRRRRGRDPRAASRSVAESARRAELDLPGAAAEERDALALDE